VRLGACPVAAVARHSNRTWHRVYSLNRPAAVPIVLSYLER
jgi:hypothetical protein